MVKPESSVYGFFICCRQQKLAVLEGFGGITMKSLKSIGLGFAAALLSAGVASAAVYNFEVPQAQERGVADGAVFDAGGGIVQVAGFNYDNATNKITGNGNFAYFDGPGSNPKGGLGVCSTLGTIGNKPNQCIPNSDDNIVEGEALGVNFGDGILTSVTFLGTPLVNGGNSHDILANGNFKFSLDGVTFLDGTTDANGVWNTGGIGVSNLTGIFFAANDFELYLHQAIYDGGPPDRGPTPAPIPAAGLMLLTALGGLGFARRRRNKKA